MFGMRSTGLAAGLCLLAVLVGAQPALAQRTVSVRSYGAVGDGVSDDTAAIQRAVNALGSGDTLAFGAGTFLVNSRLGITLKSNIRLDLRGATLLAPNVAGANCRVFTAHAVANVVIWGGTLIGDRSGRPGFGIGILLSDAVNVMIKDVTVRDFFFDGILLTGNTGCRDIRITGVVAENNRRAGLTAVAATNVIVEFSTFRGTVGQEPQAGLNFEPNRGGSVAGVRLFRTTVAGNAGPGLYVHQGLGVSTSGLSVLQCIFDGNLYGIVAARVAGVTISGNRFYRHRTAATSAMHLALVTDTAVTANLLEDNYRGIFVVGAREALIRGNSITGRGLLAGAGEGANGITCLGYNAVDRDACSIIGNMVRRASSAGITAQDVASIVVADNVVEDAGQRGIYLRGSSENEVRNNTIRGSGLAAPMQTDGIEMALGSHRNVVSLNTIYLSSTMRTPIGVGPGCSGNDVRQNTVYRGPRS